MHRRIALVVVASSVIVFAIAYLTRERPIDGARRLPATEQTTMTSVPDSPSKGHDIGLGFRVCNVAQVENLDLGGEWSAATAWTATRLRSDGRCTQSQASSYFVAIDVDGDDFADASSSPLRHCFFCRPVAAIDMDGDEDGELLVLEQGGSVSSYSFYDIEPVRDSVLIRTIRVAAPGHREARHAPGKPLRFWVGGDEGYSAAATCTGYPGDPVLVATWSNHPVEGPGSETTEVHRTSFRLRDGGFQVVEATDTEEPTDHYRPSGLMQSRSVCGVDLSRSG